MQYILTEEEYKSLVPKWKYDEKLKEIKELQLLLMKATGYTCIYESAGDYMFSYCDNCPIANFDCGRRKEFSK
jgi:hypothetical protein